MIHILYCDESADKGEKFCDFFGGCIIKSTDLYRVTKALEDKKTALNLGKEIKWTKVTDRYLPKYMEMMDLFFSFVKEGTVKVRVMFRSKEDVPSQPELRRNDEKYFKLYYQFLKHSFGLTEIPEQELPVRLLINLDTLPDKHGQRKEFKEFLCRLPETLHNDRLMIAPEDISEVDSHQHVLLQCVDIVMGAMYFRLNGLHKVIPEGKSRRGKKTVAKDELYQHIYHHIAEIHKNFNAGISTGSHGYTSPHWESPYEHWRFRPY